MARRWHAGLPRMVVLLAAASVAIAPAMALAPTAAAAPTGFATRSLSPQGDYADRLSFDVTELDPVVVTASGPASLTVTGTMTNTGPEALTDLVYRFQRGPALTSTADLHDELAEPSEPVGVVQPDFAALGDRLAPGQTAPFTATVSITGGNGLAIEAPAVYPLMINVNGDVSLGGGSLPARIGEVHLALTVVGVPTATGAQPATAPGTPSKSTPGTSTPEPAASAGAAPAPVPVNILWPLVETTHLGVDGVFLNDALAASIAPGGRLNTLVDALTAPGAPAPPAGSVTLAIDPALLDELDRMSRGYRVLADPSSPQAPLTPAVGPTEPTATGTTSPTTQTLAGITTAGTPTQTVPPTAPATPTETPAGVPEAATAGTPGTVAGTGEAAAAAFLAQLRMLIARYPTLLLPAGDPDVVALVRSGMADQVSAAVTQGRTIASRVLGAEAAARLVTGMSLPVDGALDPATLTALTDAGLGSAVLSGESVRLTGAGSTRNTPSTGSTVAAIDTTTGAAANPERSVTIPTVLSRAGVLAGLGALADRPPTAGWAIRVSTLTALLAQQHFDSDTSPSVYVPDHRWSPDRAGLRLLTDMLATLGTDRVIGAVSLADLAGSPGTPARLSYPADAQADELTPEYLARVQKAQQNVAALRTTLDSIPQTVDPAAVLDPLDAALAASGSSAFRTDPNVGEANLATVEATTTAIRDGVTISSAGNSYTLASSTSPLVLTVQNTLPYNVPVQVQITGGDRVGLTVTDPGVQVIPAGRSLQVKIPAEVTRSGQFQVGAQLVAPDGEAWNEPVQLSVESSAYGAVTVIIIIVAGGVLLVMVVLRVRQRLHDRRDKGSDNDNDDNDNAAVRSGGAAIPQNGSRPLADSGTDRVLPDESLRLGGPPVTDPALRSVIPGSAPAPTAPSAPAGAADAGQPGSDLS